MASGSRHDEADSNHMAPKDHVLLVLPFGNSVYPDPSPVLPVIYRTMIDSAAESLVVLFYTPTSHLVKSRPLLSYLRERPHTSWLTFQAFLGKVYATMAAAQWSAGKVLMDVEVQFDIGDGSGIRRLPHDISDYNVIFAGSDISTLPAGLSVLEADITYIPPPQAQDQHSFNFPPSMVLPVVALGGTFDHLHAAHKLLLQLALFLSHRRLIVGVISDSLLGSKSNAHLVEPLGFRISAIESFLLRCGARARGSQGEGVEMDVVEIHDPFGPTAWDPDIQALVVSRETLSGGEMVNTKRNQSDLGELELFVVDVISSALEESGDTDVDGEVVARRGLHGAGLNEHSEVGGELSGRQASVGEDEDGGILRPCGREKSRTSESVRTRDLRGEVDEKRLKELKMGSTAIRQWIAERGRD